jgi:hypothetical protein
MPSEFRALDVDELITPVAAHPGTIRNWNPASPKNGSLESAQGILSEFA